MIERRVACLFVLLSIHARPIAAQPPPPKEPPPLWDVQVGASFVGTAGNSETTSTGGDFAAHRRGAVAAMNSHLALKIGYLLR